MKLEKVGIGALVGFVAAEAYRLLATQEQKDRWEGFIGTHHGEAGIVGAVIGMATKSPTLAGVGIGLAIHDANDVHEWFKE